MNELARVEISEQGEIVLASVRGEVDISNAQATGDELLRAVPGAALGLVLDFRSLDFLDSSGVSMLFALARRLGSHRQQLRVVAGADQAVGRVLSIVDFGRAAPVHESVEGAMADFG